MNYFPGSLHQVPEVNLLLIIWPGGGVWAWVGSGSSTQPATVSSLYSPHIAQRHPLKEANMVQILHYGTYHPKSQGSSSSKTGFLFSFNSSTWGECLSVISTRAPFLLKEDLVPSYHQLSSLLLPFHLYQRRSLPLPPSSWERMTFIMPHHLHHAQKFQIHSPFTGALLQKFKPFDLDHIYKRQGQGGF